MLQVWKAACLGAWLWRSHGDAEFVELGPALEEPELDDVAPVDMPDEEPEFDDVAPVGAPDEEPELDDVAPVGAPDEETGLDDAEDASANAKAVEGGAEPKVSDASATVAAGTASSTELEAKVDANESSDPPGTKPTLSDRMSTLAEHVELGGFIQVDFLRRQISEDELSAGTRDPLNETQFVLRNARFGANADWRYIGTTMFVEMFSNGGPVRPATMDVHVQIPRKGNAPPWARLRVGLLRVPFGFENFDQNDAQRFFGERTLVSHAYVPGLFDVGASLSGQLWALRWIVGVYNGQPVGAPGFGYRDPNAAKDYVGRLHLRGDVAEWLDASLGFSFLSGTGFSAGTAPTKDSFDWVDLNEDGRVTMAEIIPIEGSAGRASENFSRWGIGADAQLRSELPRVGELMLYAEMAVGHNLDRAVAIADPVLLRRDQRGIGWYVGLTQQLTRHATVGVRFDQYHPDLDALEPFDGTTVITRRRFQTISAGAAAHLHQGERIQARLLFEYEHQRNSLGRDLQGRPDQLDNDTLRVRAEVVF